MPLKRPTALLPATVAIMFVGTLVSPAVAQLKISGWNSKLGDSKGDVRRSGPISDLQKTTFDSAVVAGRTMTSHFQDVLNVKDAPFSAKGDGSTNDTLALQMWAAALAGWNADHSGAGMLGWVPCGIYVFNQTVRFPADKLIVQGSGPCTEFAYAGSGDAFFVGKDDAYTSGTGVATDTFRDFRLYRTAADTAAGVGIRIANPTSFVLTRTEVNYFWRDVVVEGGDNTHLVSNRFLGGAPFASAPMADSALLDIEPFVWKNASNAATTTCPSSIFLNEYNMGGKYVQAGVRIACVDGLYTGGLGHIGGHVINDIEIDRLKGHGAQSVDITGYLDDAERAVYVASPTGSGSDAGGAGAYNIRIEPFQVANQTANAVEIWDPTADVTVFASHFFNIFGWGVYAPFADKVFVENTEFFNVGTNPALKAGGIEIGINQTNADGSLAAAGVAGGRAPGRVGAAFITSNSFFGVADCIFTANLGQGITALNQLAPCTKGKSVDTFASGPSVAGSVARHLSAPNGDGSSNLAGASCSGPPTSRFRSINGIVIHC